MLDPLFLSRCSILAAANSVFGRWDDAKAEENIDFMPTILSRYNLSIFYLKSKFLFNQKGLKISPSIFMQCLFRFDTIFIVKDEHDETRDMTLARHVMQVIFEANLQLDNRCIFANWLAF